MTDPGIDHEDEGEREGRGPGETLNGTAGAVGGPGRRKGDDEVLVAARAAGMTVSEAAQAAGFSERTARRRLNEPDVAARLAERRADRRAEHLARLEGLVPKAICRLDELLDSQHAATLLGAIRTVLTFEPRLYEQHELEARVRHIETLAARQQARATTEVVDAWPT